MFTMAIYLANCIANGYFHEVQIFTKSTNVPTTHENLCWAVSEV